MTYCGPVWRARVRVATEIVLTDEERAELTRLARSRLTSVRLALRARIVVLAAQGLQNIEIAARLGVGRVQVSRWRERYIESRLAGIERDLPRGAPPTTVDVARLVELTTQSTPEAATHWSTRTMAAELGVSAASVSRYWRKNGLKPHLVRGFKVSRDPQFIEKLEDIVGLYLSPPEHALVLSVDEKSQIQALDRTQPGLPMKKGRAGTMTHDYKRHGTTTLFAALDVLEGKVIGRCMQRHRHQEFIRFLNAIEKTVPARKTVHVILDNYAAHKHPKVIAWLARHPRVTFHFTPTSASWLNAVEGFFAVLTKRRLKRGTFVGIVDLQAAINRYVADHNTDPKPFRWKANPDKIIAAAARGHQTLDSIHSHDC